jgi:hypothetical protein
MDHPQDGTSRLLCCLILLVCCMEYGMWISTSFDLEDNLLHPYYWFDITLSISFLLYISALKKKGAPA